MSYYLLYSGFSDQIGGVINLPPLITHIPRLQGNTVTLPAGLSLQSGGRSIEWALVNPPPGVLPLTNINSPTPHSPLIGNVQVTTDKRMIIHDRQTNYACGSLRMFSPLRAPVTDTTDLTMQTWEWNGTNWVEDPLNVGLGKPLHTTTDNLVDGLSISWTDLQAGNTKNLIQDQYYVFTRTTAPNTVPIEAHTPTINISNYLSMRPKVDSNTTFTNLNSVNPIYVKENPLGTNPDSNFYAVNSTAFFTDTLTSNDLLLTGTLNGISVIINSTLLATTPSAGQINVTKGGRVLVNSADNGKTLLLNYSYSRKVDSSEIAVTP